MTNGVISGPTLSGKSTVAHALSKEYWRRYKMRSLALDLHAEDHPKWGPQCLVTDDEEKFWELVWKADGMLIFVDDGSATIARSKDLIPVFTRMRHNHHKLVVITHSATDLLPAMRNNIDTLWLFRQNRKAAQIWADTLAEERLLEATTLKQYEFIFYQSFGSPIKGKTSKI